MVEKKLRVSFHASALVVENARPTEVKYAALVVEKKSRAFFHASFEVVENARPTLEKYVALVVEKKNPLSIAVRYDELSEVVAITLPCAFVERRALGMFAMARLVVVALVVVLLPVMTRLPLIVELAAMRPFENVRSEVVALFGNGSCTVEPVASVPQLNTPAADALTSQDAALRDDTVRLVVDPFVPKRFVAKNDVEVALVVVAFPVMMMLPTKVEDAALMTRPDVVALVPAVGWSHASKVRRPVASVPQLKTPAADAFTSQLAAFRFETMRFEVDARPETERLVVVAAPPVIVENVTSPVFEIVKSVVVPLTVEDPTANSIEFVSPLFA